MARTAGACTALAFLLAAAAGCEPQPVEEGAREEAPEVAPAPTPAPGAAQLGVRQKEGLGTYLTDASGRSLYLFLADTAAAPGGQRASTCYDACAQAWPPLLSEGEPVAADPTVRGPMLGTVERRDGARQVTYNGWPLYYYARDQNPGDTNGQDVEGFGAEWYLVSPDGNPLRREAGGGQ
jgi:predicted lipoprotein with Yx(FWY)xxD motif